MRCPGCGSLDDKVVDSRQGDDGTAIRRRRECLACSRRFTTFERLEEVPLMVVKRSGQRVPFDRAKIVRGIQAAAKARPVTLAQMEQLAAEVEESLRMAGGGDVPSQRVGVRVLERLRDLDAVASVRFASVYKGFEGIEDFERELGLLNKVTAPKRH